MADGDLTQQQQEPLLTGEVEERLKHLEFVEAAALQAISYLYQLYVLAKEKSGPLKLGVETVEGTVKSVVGPVCVKYHKVPTEVLKYADRKVGESVTEWDRHAPPFIKQISAQAFSAAQRFPTIARDVASEVQRTSVKDTATRLAKTVYSGYEPAAKEFYNKYGPKAEQGAVSAWRKLNQVPLFPQVAQVVLPTAAYCTEKYNQTVASTAKKGYRVSSYLPSVPIEKIAKVFNEKEVEPQPLEAN